MIIEIELKSKRKGFNAKATYNTDTRETIVLKGSTVSDDVSQAKTFTGTKAVERNRAQYVVKNTVKEDVVFKSPSTAGNFVTGHSTDGFRSWKTKDNKKLCDL